MPPEDDAWHANSVPVAPTKQRPTQAMEDHDLGAITVEMASLFEENDGSEFQEELDDEEEPRYLGKGTGQDEEASYSGLETSDDEDDEDEEGGDDESEMTLETGPDTWIRDQFQAYCGEAKKNNMRFTEEEKTAIRLLKLLHDKKASINTYDSLMLWHLRESGVLYDFQTLRDCSSFIGRKTLVEKLMKRYNCDDKLPMTRKVKLPVSQNSVRLTLFNTRAAMQRLLTDPRIEPKDYLFWEAGDPLAAPPEEVDVIKDLNTGQAYLETHVRLVSDDPRRREALMPVVIYFDGTVVSQFHSLEVCHVNIALGTFTRVARTKDFMWAPLGVVEKVSGKEGGRGQNIIKQSFHMDNQDDLLHQDSDSSASTVESMDGVGEKPDQDIHAMLAVILEEFVSLQETGFLWDHHDPATGKDTFNIHYKIFVPFMKLDTKEADLACGKYQERRMAQQNCRNCHVRTLASDDHLHKCKPKTMSEIKKLVENADAEGLRALSQQHLTNAFYKVRFSMGNDKGVHGSCPAELLHAFLLGTFKYIRDVFFALVGKSSEGARKINALAAEYGKAFVRQSDRTQPATFFTRGIQEGLLMAKDFRGVLLLILACCRSTKGRAILLNQKKSAFRKNEALVDDWIMLLELMLEWESFLNEPQILVKHVKKLEKKHRYIMYLIRKVAQRTTGMGLKLYKFHCILHIWQDILDFGVPLEYDTSPNESMHKPTKAAAKMTQRNLDTFNFQTALRLSEFYVVSLALFEIETGNVPWNYYERKMAESPPEETEREETWTGDTQISVLRDKETGEPAFYLRSQSKYKGKTIWNTDLLAFLVDLQVKVKEASGTMQIFTCHKRNGQIFRGHPNYRGKGSWKDWAWIDWGSGYGDLPSHIWCFVKLSGVPPLRGSLALDHGGIKLCDGVFAVVESAQLEEHDGGELPFMTPVMKDIEKIDADGIVTRTFYLADTEAIVDPACVIPDLGGPPNRYFVVRPRNDWANEFRKWVDDPSRLDEMDDLPVVEEMPQKQKGANRNKKKKKKGNEDKEAEEKEEEQPEGNIRSPARKRRNQGKK